MIYIGAFMIAAYLSTLVAVERPEPMSPSNSSENAIPNDHPDERTGTGRLEAFSDGVIAIAITLLVLEISVPTGTGSLLERLAGQWIVYVAYLVSFIVVGATWLSHHQVISDIRKGDHGLYLLNLALLLVISFIPFPTKVVGEEFLSPHVDDQRTAAILYGLTFLVLGLAFNALWWWAVHRQLLHFNVTPAEIYRRTLVFRLGPVAYAVTIALAFINPTLSIIATGLVALSFLIPLPAPKHQPRNNLKGSQA